MLVWALVPWILSSHNDVAMIIHVSSCLVVKGRFK